MLDLGGDGELQALGLGPCMFELREGIVAVAANCGEHLFEPGVLESSGVEVGDGFVALASAILDIDFELVYAPVCGTQVGERLALLSLHLGQPLVDAFEIDLGLNEAGLRLVVFLRPAGEFGAEPVEFARAVGERGPGLVARPARVVACPFEFNAGLVQRVALALSLGNELFEAGDDGRRSRKFFGGRLAHSALVVEGTDGFAQELRLFRLLRAGLGELPSGFDMCGFGRVELFFELDGDAVALRLESRLRCYEFGDARTCVGEGLGGLVTLALEAFGFVVLFGERRLRGGQPRAALFEFGREVVALRLESRLRGFEFGDARVRVSVRVWAASSRSLLRRSVSSCCSASADCAAASRARLSSSSVVRWSRSASSRACEASSSATRVRVSVSACMIASRSVSSGCSASAVSAAASRERVSSSSVVTRSRSAAMTSRSVASRSSATSSSATRVRVSASACMIASRSVSSGCSASAVSAAASRERVSSSSLATRSRSASTEWSCMTRVDVSAAARSRSASAISKPAMRASNSRTRSSASRRSAARASVSCSSSATRSVRVAHCASRSFASRVSVSTCCTGLVALGCVQRDARTQRFDLGGGLPQPFVEVFASGFDRLLFGAGGLGRFLRALHFVARRIERRPGCEQLVANVVGRFLGGVASDGERFEVGAHLFQLGMPSLGARGSVFEDTFVGNARELGLDRGDRRSLFDDDFDDDRFGDVLVDRFRFGLGL